MPDDMAKSPGGCWTRPAGGLCPSPAREPEERACARPRFPATPPRRRSAPVSSISTATGRYDVKTGVGFLDHMLEQLSRHSLDRPDGRGRRATPISTCTTPPRTSGSRSGRPSRKRSATARASPATPRSTCRWTRLCTRAAVDVSGRPYLVWQVTFERPKVGDFDTELFKEFFQALAQNAGPHAACGEPLRREQPPYRRDLLQGCGAGFPRRLCRSIRATPTLCPPPRALLTRLETRMRSYSVHAPPRRPLRARALRGSSRTASPGRAVRADPAGFSGIAFGWRSSAISSTCRRSSIAAGRPARRTRRSSACWGAILFALEANDSAGGRSTAGAGARSAAVSARTSTRRKRASSSRGGAPSDGPARRAAAAYPAARTADGDEPILGLFPEPER